MMKPKTDDRELVATNKKARHDYFVIDSLEAGICLDGCEIKSIREHRLSIMESFARPKGSEMMLYGMHVVPYASARDVRDPVRPRKLLMHKKQIRKWSVTVLQEGFTIVPLSVYLLRGLAKVELALVRGKGHADRREDIKKRDAKRQIDRVMKSSRRGG